MPMCPSTTGSRRTRNATADELGDVLRSTGVATPFLDTDLAIRFFTPATRALFGIIATDVGRPLADLRRLDADGQALPSIMITGPGDVATAVEATKAGASDFLEKPVGRDAPSAGVARATASRRRGLE